jgi:hypothetical protein
MKKISNLAFSRLISVISLIVSLTAFSVLVPENPAEAQHNNPAPIVTAILPAEAEQGTSIEISIYGNYFFKTAQVYFSPSSGIGVIGIDVLSPEEINVYIEIGKDISTGARDVTVINPDQQSCTLKAGFKIRQAPAPSTTTASPPAPIITRLSSNEFTPGKTQEIIIYGNNFSPDSKLIISPSEGIGIDFLQVSGSEKILAGLTVAGYAQTGYRDITVINPDQQSDTLEEGLYLKAAVSPSPVIVPFPTTTSATTAAANTKTPVAGTTTPTATGTTPATNITTPAITGTANSEVQGFLNINVPAPGFFQKLVRNTHRFFSGLTNKISIWWQEIRIRHDFKSINDIRGDAFSLINVPPVVQTPCLEPQTVIYRTLYVAAPRKTGKIIMGDTADGSAKYPFLTIADALAKAEEFRYEGIEIYITHGFYDGSLNITRPTKLTGESRENVIIAGSITNTSVYSLTLENLSMQGSKTTGGGTGREGMLSVSNICASTTIMHVDIRGALDYGIIQRGGKLNLLDVCIYDIVAGNEPFSGSAMHLTSVDAALTGVFIERSGSYGIRQIGGSLIASGIFVHNTMTKEEYSEAGTGIFASDGARIDISRSFFKGNRSSAIIIRGNGTEAALRNTTVYNTKINPWLLNYIVLDSSDGLIEVPSVRLPSTAFGAIEARDEAQLVIDHCRITDNEYLGLVVTDNARARVTDTTVSRTNIPSGGISSFAVNIKAKNGGYIYLENVICSHAGLGGLFLYGGTMDYHVGEVSYCPVGANIVTPGFDVSRLADRVAYANNGVNLQSESLPIPDASVPD